ncbi:MAG: diacylglycerol kinase family lipid kinase [Deltaproteobacteria bacterium]|nr:diacylglycerol kinase family lipid kinase [Deltaproteobacteria bacterium]
MAKLANKTSSSTSDKVVFVLNPKSASGATRRKFERLRGRYQAAFPQMEVQLTNAQGHATELATAALKKGVETIVVVGGDGTINEVANGFFDDEGNAYSQKAALGVLTSGTGGDFRKTFGWSLDEKESLARLKRREVSSVDVGRMWCTNDDGEKVHRLWVNIASFGLSGAVDEEVQKSGKSLGGKAAFFFATTRAMVGHKKSRVRLTQDDNAPVEKDLTLLALGNGQFFGGGMWIAPEADIRDGFLDVIDFGAAGPRFWLTKGLSIYKGKHLGLAEVKSGRCQRLLAEPVNEDIIKIDLDGELPGHLPAEFSVMPRALQLIV